MLPHLAYPRVAAATAESRETHANTKTKMPALSHDASRFSSAAFLNVFMHLRRRINKGHFGILAHSPFLIPQRSCAPQHQMSSYSGDKNYPYKDGLGLTSRLTDCDDGGAAAGAGVRSLDNMAGIRRTPLGKRGNSGNPKNKKMK